jgi:hypothetical protein
VSFPPKFWQPEGVLQPRLKNFGLMYALGRGVEYYDRPAIRVIAREAALDNQRWSSIILGVVKSVPFQMRRAE